MVVLRKCWRFGLRERYSYNLTRSCSARTPERHAGAVATPHRACAPTAPPGGLCVLERDRMPGEFQVRVALTPFCCIRFGCSCVCGRYNLEPTSYVFAVDTTYKSMLFAQPVKNLPRSRSMPRTSSSTGCHMSFAGLCREKSSCCSLCSALPCGCSEATR